MYILQTPEGGSKNVENGKQPLKTEKKRKRKEEGVRGGSSQYVLKYIPRVPRTLKSA